MDLTFGNFLDSHIKAGYSFNKRLHAFMPLFMLKCRIICACLSSKDLYSSLLMKRDKQI